MQLILTQIAKVSQSVASTIIATCKGKHHKNTERQLDIAHSQIWQVNMGQPVTIKAA